MLGGLILSKLSKKTSSYKLLEKLLILGLSLFFSAVMVLLRNEISQVATQMIRNFSNVTKILKEKQLYQTHRQKVSFIIIV